ncbi:hypothetical protein C8A00DRAFT_47607 [Chaetomidium leptoderma]|uniref:Methyltransferase domain-containing protein n=1 Tax=Chaetomidium leptoderma TaxID=669021 RepID=A0AAN6VBT6_9PEZI|nr:hypothetical protein C8A00DRAFT_47607 [Chaetomidium leptoderma]
MSTSQSKTGASDWSPDQYLLFRNARNRAIHDLIAFLGPEYSPDRITDLGCGPGNSTEILASRFPHATITGIDSSPAMLTQARTTSLPNTTFAQADLHTYDPGQGVDLLFSNAVFHWLRRRDRIPTLTRLLLTQQLGRGTLAFQVPDNHDEPSHRAMRETAASPPGANEPDLDPIETPLEYYNALKPHCRAVETWTTRYVHVMEDHGAIVEWAKGTGLQPFVNLLPAAEEAGGVDVREAFLEAYRQRLEKEYPRAEDGRVLLTYPRRFVVAFR